MALLQPQPSTCCSGNGCHNCNDSGLLVDQPVAIVVECYEMDGAHDGPGWYYWDNEYRDEGSVGAFATREEAEAHAKDAGYRFETPESPTDG